ncbi:hypothetical protein KEG38_14855 [Polyangium jinanense]|uniref:hypothetical protein n=1 Tax=Polyangium jinanense TaxID=2829994 RepID=UPI002340517C|nr:hypothetical protein [Polyangium jinanense]MDC3955142.1 hypothetical protein [Polyangium jinanense]
MKTSFGFDPADYEYGPATPYVRRVLNEFSAIDWFVPPSCASHRERAVALLGEHNELARSYEPGLFPAPEDITIRAEIADASRFIELCELAKAVPSEWDWKYGALKKLLVRHRNGWSRLEQARALQPLTPGEPRPGDLFMSIGETVLWYLPCNLDTSGLPKDHADAASWYFGYAFTDMVECLEWQFAQKNTTLEANPFYSLLRCYGTGFYPFRLKPTSFVLCALGA